MKRKKLGEVLRERGYISTTDLSKAIEEQQGKLIHLGELMLQRGMVKKSDLVAALGEVTRVPYVDCTTVQVQPEALKLVPRSVAERHSILPLAREGPRLVAAMAEPQNLHALDELCFTSGMGISARLGFRAEIQAAIEKYYAEGAQPRGTKAEQEKRLDRRERCLGDGVLLHQLEAEQSGSHEGSARGVPAEAHAGGARGLCHHRGGDREAGQ